MHSQKRTCIIKEASPITVTSWLNTDDTPGNQAFLQNYSATFGTEPNAFATMSYTALYILFEAIREVKSTDSTAIRDALANIRDFDTVLGKFAFDANGDAIYEPKALIVKNGTLQLLESSYLIACTGGAPCLPAILAAALS